MKRPTTCPTAAWALLLLAWAATPLAGGALQEPAAETGDAEAGEQAPEQPPEQPPEEAPAGEPATAEPTVEGLQSGLYVLRVQVKDFLASARALPDPSPQEIELMGRVDEALAEAAQVEKIFSVPRLKEIDSRLLLLQKALDEMLNSRLSAGGESAALAGESPGAPADGGADGGGDLEIEPAPAGLVQAGVPESGSPPTPGGERPADLRPAAEAYFRGEYAESLDRLPAAPLADPMEARARLISAAALFALYRIDGGEDPATLEVASDEVRACRGLDPDLRPDPTLFSPAFIAFFDGVELP